MRNSKFRFISSSINKAEGLSNSIFHKIFYQIIVLLNFYFYICPIQPININKIIQEYLKLA